MAFSSFVRMAVQPPVQRSFVIVRGPLARGQSSGLLRGGRGWRSLRRASCMQVAVAAAGGAERGGARRRGVCRRSGSLRRDGHDGTACAKPASRARARRASLPANRAAGAAGEVQPPRPGYGIVDAGWALSSSVPGSATRSAWRSSTRARQRRRGGGRRRASERGAFEPGDELDEAEAVHRGHFARPADQRVLPRRCRRRWRPSCPASVGKSMPMLPPRSSRWSASGQRGDRPASARASGGNRAVDVDQGHRRGREAGDDRAPPGKTSSPERGCVDVLVHSRPGTRARWAEPALHLVASLSRSQGQRGSAGRIASGSARTWARLVRPFSAIAARGRARASGGAFGRESAGVGRPRPLRHRRSARGRVLGVSIWRAGDAVASSTSPGFSPPGHSIRAATGCGRSCDRIARSSPMPAFVPATRRTLGKHQGIAKPAARSRARVSNRGRPITPEWLPPSQAKSPRRWPWMA